MTPQPKRNPGLPITRTIKEPQHLTLPPMTRAMYEQRKEMVR